MATNPYDTAYARAQADQRKLFGNIKNDYNSRGALFSSAIYKPMTQVTDELSRRMAEEQRQDRQFDESNRRYNLDSAMRLYEMLSSRGLSAAQLGLKNKYRRLPGDFGFFRNLSKTSFLPPKSGYGPTGDVTTDKKMGEKVPRYTLEGTTLAERNESRMASDADANRAIQKGYLDLARQQAQPKPEEQVDPWQYMATRATENKMMFDEAGNFVGMPGEDILNEFRTMFPDIDVLRMAEAEKDPRAIALMRMLFGAEWNPSFLNQGVPEPAYLGFHNQTQAAPQQDGRVFGFGQKTPGQTWGNYLNDSLSNLASGKWF